MAANNNNNNFNKIQQFSSVGKIPLKIKSTRAFVKIWDDRSTGSQPHKISIFKPICDPDWYTIGDVAANHRKDGFGSIGILVQDPSQQQNLLSKPTDFKLIWNDRGTGGEYGDVFLWEPIAPSGFISIGHVATQTKKKPSIDKSNYRCVSEKSCTVGSVIYENDGCALWADRCSRAKIGDCSLWSVRANLLADPAGLTPGTWIVKKNYSKPKKTFHVLVNPFYKPPPKQQQPVYQQQQQQQQYATTNMGSSSTNNNNYQQQYQYTTPTNSPHTPQEYYARFPSAQSQEQVFYNQPTAPPPGASSNSVGATPDGYGLLRITYPQNFRQVVKTPVIEVAPFEISLDQVQKLWSEWKKSLWFAPGNFSKICDKLNVKQSYVPYFGYDVHCSSAFDGDVGFSRYRKDCDGNNQHYYEWQRRTGIRQKGYDNVLACATKNPELKSQMQRIQKDFDLTKAVPSLKTSDEAFEKPYDWQKVWQSEGEPVVVKSERKACRHQLRQEARADTTKNVAVKLAITSLAYRFAYVPVYACHYTWNDKIYKLWINGQTGKIYGKRPYGLGALGALFSKSPKDDNRSGLVTGELLSNEEKKSQYNPTSTYLVFPPSERKMLVSRYWGSIELTNTGTHPLELFSHMRKSTRRGLMFELAPGATQSFRYEGFWCIEITSGNANNLKIESFTQRTDEVHPNYLGMAHL